MRMDEMNAYFESKGFEVKRSYKKDKSTKYEGCYSFLISKHGNYQYGEYFWPRNQKSFMDRMIRDFEDAFEKKHLNREHFLVYTNAPRHWLESVSYLLSYGPKVTHVVNRLKYEIETNHINIKFTNDQKYVEQDGLNWDEIFIDVINYPPVLNHRWMRSMYTIDVYPGTLVQNIRDVENKCEMANTFRDTYFDNDIKTTEEVYKFMNDNYIQTLKTRIKNVIFNDPATIVFWTDGTKTVVKCQDGEEFDPEKGLAMAISKKALGNKYAYYHDFLHWLKKYEKEYYWKAETKDQLKFDIKIPDTSKLADACKAMQNLGKQIRDMNKKSAAKKAYDMLVGWRDGKVPVSKEISENMDQIEELIGYLGEALED